MRNFDDGKNIRSMEARRGAVRLTCRTGSPSTTRGRRFATTTSRMHWTTSAIEKIGSRNTAISRHVLKNLKLLSRRLGRILIDFDEERKNSCEKYDVNAVKEQDLRLYHQGIGQTWSPMNPGHQKASNWSANCAAKVCNCKRQLCHRVSHEILFET